MTLCLSKIDSELGISTCFSDSSISKYEKIISSAVEEFSRRANQAGQFLNWVDLPKNQLARLDEIYSLASSLKSQTNATKLTILGIGGSKHTVENMLSLNGLNLNADEILEEINIQNEDNKSAMKTAIEALCTIMDREDFKNLIPSNGDSNSDGSSNE